MEGHNRDASRHKFWKENYSNLIFNKIIGRAAIKHILTVRLAEPI